MLRNLLNSDLISCSTSVQWELHLEVASSASPSAAATVAALVVTAALGKRYGSGPRSWFNAWIPPNGDSSQTLNGSPQHPTCFVEIASAAFDASAASADFAAAIAGWIVGSAAGFAGSGLTSASSALIEASAVATAALLGSPP